MCSSQLRVEVTAPFDRGSHVRQYQVPDSLLACALPVEVDGRDAEPLLEDLLSQRHRSRAHASDVGVMCSRRHVAERCARLRVPDWGDQGDVGQMRPASEGVVQADDVPHVERAQLTEGGLHAHRHRPQVDRHVVAKGDGCTPRRKECARVISALLDVGRKGCPPERGSHLLSQSCKEVAEDLERYGVGLPPSAWPSIEHGLDSPAKSASHTCEVACVRIGYSIRS